MHTLSNKITPIDALQGSAAELSAASIIFAATDFGIPVSTTQTITGAITGTGLSKGITAIYWPMLRMIFLSWFMTIPAVACISGLIMFVLR